MGWRTVAVALALLPVAAPAQENECENSASVAGVWKLTEAYTEYRDGRIDHPYGKPPAGIFVYTPGGHLSLHLGVNPPPPPFESRPGDAEIGALARRHIAYFGRWSVSADGASLIHHIEGALNPGRIGRDAVRPFRLCNDTLELDIESSNGNRYFRRLERIEHFDRDRSDRD